jgi:hypothetical protein
MLCQTFSRILVIFAFAVVPNAANADLVKLLNGGELRGKIASSGDSKQNIRLETLTGAVVVVERDQTQFVTMRSVMVEEYESRSRQIEDTWEAHWELSEWCRLHGLTKQRETHLLRVTELSPEHEKAQLALKRVWHKGHWVDRDELMASQGYVKYKNRYITTQEMEIIEKTTDELKLERLWPPKIRMWLAALEDPNSSRGGQGLNELRNINDPHAVNAVIKFMCGDSRVEIRQLSVAILIKIAGGKAIAGLVQMALFDESPDVRSAALEGIGSDSYQYAQSGFIRSLKSEDNAIVCRAASALGKIGDKNAVGPLIEALVTAHQYQVATDIPVQPSYSFTTDGNFGSNNQTLPPEIMAAVRTGHMQTPIIAPSGDSIPKKVVAVRVDHYNKEALSALEKLTEKNFGYDKRTWKLWWSAEKNMGGKSVK